MQRRHRGAKSLPGPGMLEKLVPSIELVLCDLGDFRASPGVHRRLEDYGRLRSFRARSIALRRAQGIVIDSTSEVHGGSNTNICQYNIGF